MRRTFSITAAASLLLCLAFCALWIRSYWVEDTVGFEVSQNAPAGPGYFFYFVCDTRGTIYAARLSDEHDPPRLVTSLKAGQRQWSWDTRRDPTPVSEGSSTPGWHFGFWIARWGFFENGSLHAWDQFAAPMWSQPALFAILPSCWLFTHRRARRRIRLRRCTRCGYDVRASPDRCPECGTVPTRAMP